MTTLHIFTWRDVNIQYHFNVCIYIYTYTHSHIYIYIINLAVSCSIFMSVTSHIQPWRNMNSSVISFACWFPCSKIDFVGIPSRDRKQKWTGHRCGFLTFFLIQIPNVFLIISDLILTFQCAGRNPPLFGLM